MNYYISGFVRVSLPWGGWFDCVGINIVCIFSVLRNKEMGNFKVLVTQSVSGRAEWEFGIISPQRLDYFYLNFLPLAIFPLAQPTG